MLKIILKLGLGALVLIVASITWLWFSNDDLSNVMKYNAARDYFMDTENPEHLKLALDAIEQPFIKGMPEAITAICKQFYSSQQESCELDMAQNKGQRWQALGKIAVGIEQPNMALRYFENAIQEGVAFAHFDALFLTVKTDPADWDAADVMARANIGATASDPRAQYLATLVQLQSIKDHEFEAKPFLIAQLAGLDNAPSIADSYYELAKFMKDDAINSDLSYEDVLIRSDFYGNTNASLLLVEFYQAAQNDEAMIVWLTKAAAYGFPRAQYNLAIQYSKNPADTDALEKSADLLVKAAKQDMPEAQTALGVLLFYGNDVVTQDLEAGVQLLERAASVDDPVALFNLGMIWLAQGSKHSQKSFDYLTRSAALGSQEAQSYLNQVGN